MWTFNMPTDHPAVSFTTVVPDDALFGEIGRGLSLAQCFGTRTGSAGREQLGAASVCIEEASNTRGNDKPFGRALPRTRRSVAWSNRDASESAAVDPQELRGKWIR